MSPDVAAFLHVARRYCDLVETAHQLKLEDRVLAFCGVLAELYAKALHLPALEPATDALLPSDRSRLPDWPGFGAYEGYMQVFDPYEPEAAIGTVLSDDLIDIYRDVKTGLNAYGTGSADVMVDAVWEWRFSFATHWGDHAVDALRALHRAAYRATGMGSLSER